MNKYEELANEIIDRVSDVIEEHYPELKPKHITDDDTIENPALINGTVYYDLESEIAEKIKRNIDMKDVIKHDLEALKDSFIFKNKKDFDYHFNLLKGNLIDCGVIER